jgi:membrane-bound lytic murein transglycosylase B
LNPITQFPRTLRGAFSSLAFALLLTGCATSRAELAKPSADAFAQRPQVREFIDRMVSQDGFDKAQLQTLFAKVRLQPAVIEAMERPAEAKPWYEYRRIFLTQARIQGGVAFWKAHREALERAQATYGVPPQIVTAIIGVETYYGRRMGRWPVFDTLATLGFDYPPRAEFFRRQLAQYLLLAKEEGFDPLVPRGSYAGAMGQGQFIPSSYRHYAVDFDGNGQRNLWTDTDDAIGSVANYFAEHGWKNGGGVAVRARVKGDPYADRRPSLKPSLSAAQLRAQGIAARHPPAGEGPFSVIRLESRNGPEYWVGEHNFYVITRYNHSPLYAMAVYQLSQAILSAHRQSLPAGTRAASEGHATGHKQLAQ